MVNVVESASAAHEATTDTNRDSNSEYGVSALFGRSSIPLVGGKVGSTPILGTNTKKEFSADGSTTRNNRVTATVAAREVNVLPDGLLPSTGGTAPATGSFEGQWVLTQASANGQTIDPAAMGVQMTATFNAGGSGTIWDGEESLACTWDLPQVQAPARRCRRSGSDPASPHGALPDPALWDR